MADTEAKAPGTSWSDIPTKGWVVFVAVMLFAVGAIVWSVNNQGPNLGSDLEARDACHTFVKDRLKSPGTAKFSGELATSAGQTWTVDGDVDSQNSFGGVVRNHFTCRANYVDGTSWGLSNLALTSN